ncbi:MAG: MmgE/PrpD family protein [Proteobacteria bacterium]|nr:MmgE/PrpD family protein [Pseudomonadota bacterium]
MIAPTLAAWAHGLTFEALPVAVVEDARRRLLDTLGVAIAALDEPLAVSVVAGAKRLGDGTEATLLSDGSTAPAPIAALVNGTLAHALDFDDTDAASVMHSSVVTVPAALAAAEAANTGGCDLLLAIAIGNEINCRLGRLAPGDFHALGFHPTSVLGCLAVTLLAGRVFGLPPAVMAAAAGIAGSLASGILEAYSDGTWSKTLHAGWAGHAGLVALRLAEAGFTGPASVVEGRYGVVATHTARGAPDPTPALDGLGTRWLQLDAAYKLYPCAHAIHAFVEAASQIRAEHALNPADVARAVAHVPEHFVGQIAEPRAEKLQPRTPTHARASLPYAVAHMLQHGTLGIEAYAPGRIGDPAVLALAARVTAIATPVERIAFSGRLQIEMRDGRRHELAIDDAKGSPARPLADSELFAKFQNCARRCLDASTAMRLFEDVMAIERLDRLGPFMRAVAVGRLRKPG